LPEEVQVEDGLATTKQKKETATRTKGKNKKTGKRHYPGDSYYRYYREKHEIARVEKRSRLVKLLIDLNTELKSMDDEDDIKQILKEQLEAAKKELSAMKKC